MLTPVQIKAYRFQSAGRGLYKSDEVDQFFEKVSASYEHIFRENSELVKRVSLLADKIEEYRKDEELIKKTLIVAQRKADELENEAAAASRKRIADADKEAEEKLSAAQAKANEVLRSAEASASQQLAAAAGKAELLRMNAEETAEARLAEAQTKVDAMLGGLQKELAEEKEALKRVKYESKFFRKKLTDSYNEQLQRIGQILSFIDEEAPAASEIAVEQLHAPVAKVFEEISSVRGNEQPKQDIRIEERLQAVLGMEQEKPAASENKEPEKASSEVFSAHEETVSEPVIIHEEKVAEEKTVFDASAEVQSEEQPVTETEEDDGDDVFVYVDSKADNDSNTYIMAGTPRSKSVDELASKYGKVENSLDGFNAAAEKTAANSDTGSDDEDDDGEGFRISLEQFVAEDEEKETEDIAETVESRLRRSFFGRRDDEDEDDDDDEYDEDDEDEDDEDDEDEEDEDDRPRRFKGFFKK